MPTPDAGVILFSRPESLAFQGRAWERVVLQFPASSDSIPPVTPNQRRGRKMSRRRGQRGYVEQKGDWWHVRYWVDTPEGRTHASHPICLAVGKGKKTRAIGKVKAKKQVKIKRVKKVTKGPKRIQQEKPVGEQEGEKG